MELVDRETVIEESGDLSIPEFRNRVKRRECGKCTEDIRISVDKPWTECLATAIEADRDGPSNHLVNKIGGETQEDESDFRSNN